MSVSVPFLLSVSIEDAVQARGSFQLYGLVESTDSIATVKTNLTNLLWDVKNMLSSRFISINLSVPIAVPGGMNPSASSGSQLQDVGVFRFNGPSFNIHPMSLVLPSVNKAKFINGVLNTGDSAVASFLTDVSTYSAHFAITDAKGIDYVSYRDSEIGLRQFAEGVARRRK